MRQKVRAALKPPPDRPRDRGESRPSATASPTPTPGVPTEEADPGAAVEAKDTCGYHPETS
jgi:hypothetical protein